MPAPLVKTSAPGIYRRGSRYSVVVRDDAGRQLKRSARTLNEARTLRSTLSSDIARGEITSASRVSFAEYAATWKSSYRGRTSRGVRPQTMEG